jgi:hypothetical protein
MVERKPWSDEKRTARFDLSKQTSKYTLREITAAINIGNSLEFNDKRCNVQKILQPGDSDPAWI